MSINKYYPNSPIVLNTIKLEKDLDLLDDNDMIGFCYVCNKKYDHTVYNEDYNCEKYQDVVKVIMPCGDCIYDKRLSNVDKILIDKFNNIISVEQVDTISEGYFGDDYEEELPDLPPVYSSIP